MTKPTSVFDTLDAGVNPSDGAVAKPVVSAANLPTSNPAVTRPTVQRAVAPPLPKGPVTPKAIPADVVPSAESRAAALAAVSAAAGTNPSDNAGLLQSLVALLLVKEGREAHAIQIKVDADAARSRQRDKNSAQENRNRLKKQAACKHLKGARGGQGKMKQAQAPDYNLSYHFFINADSVIKCHSCGMRWMEDDTAQFLFRGGYQIPNHTRVGWVEAQGMWNQSSNTQSSSEIPGSIMGGRQKQFGLTPQNDDDSDSVIRDMEGNVVPNVQI